MKTTNSLAAALIFWGFCGSASAQTPLAAPVAIPGPAVIKADFPDPFLLDANHETIAYATNRAGGPNVQMAVSTDLKRWQRLSADALPILPAWARAGNTWAPEVLALNEGGKALYRLYFTARHAESGLQCIGVASAEQARGQFVPQPGPPLVCQWSEGGSIDASPFRDADGTLTLLFKNDGNHVGRPTHIFAQPLSADGLRMEGKPVRLLANDAPWEGHVVEAPTMVARNGATYLFFSANYYGWPRGAAASPYAIGVARCDTPLGPCRDLPGNPIMSSGAGPYGCRSGPGHQAILQREGETILAYHAWESGPGCTPLGPRRFMHVGRLDWAD